MEQAQLIEAIQHPPARNADYNHHRHRDHEKKTDIAHARLQTEILHKVEKRRMGQIEKERGRKQERHGTLPEILPDLGKGRTAQNFLIQIRQHPGQPFTEQHAENQGDKSEKRNTGVDIRLVAHQGKKDFAQRRQRRQRDHHNDAGDTEALCAFLLGNELHQQGDHGRGQKYENDPMGNAQNKQRCHVGSRQVRAGCQYHEDQG
ncbi:MAG: hypothetical protein A4E66_02656 [Syntrophus sp. PtaB.Bin001]|nr:MAG: hypothetical protein A4E66_02656 [Syntrophus sp. PtaB.Bin001]